MKNCMDCKLFRLCNQTPYYMYRLQNTDPELIQKTLDKAEGCEFYAEGDSGMVQEKIIRLEKGEK